MKKISLILLIAMLFSLVSCGASYSDTMSSSELANVGLSGVTTQGGTKVLDDDVILEFTDEAPSYLRDYSVIKAKNAKNINEIGIFRCEDGKAESWLPYVKAYVENLINSYRNMDYFPEEKEKYECATFKVMGNYVIYSFLSEADTEAFYNAIENAIKQ